MGATMTRRDANCGVHTPQCLDALWTRESLEKQGRVHTSTQSTQNRAPYVRARARIGPLFVFHFISFYVWTVWTYGRSLILLGTPTSMFGPHTKCRGHAGFLVKGLIEGAR